MLGSRPRYGARSASVDLCAPCPAPWSSFTTIEHRRNEERRARASKPPGAFAGIEDDAVLGRAEGGAASAADGERTTADEQDDRGGARQTRWRWQRDHASPSRCPRHTELVGGLAARDARPIRTARPRSSSDHAGAFPSACAAPYQRALTLLAQAELRTVMITSRKAPSPPRSSSRTWPSRSTPRSRC